MLPCRASGVYIGAWPPPSSGSPPCLPSASLGLVWGRNCNRNTQRMCSGEYLLTGPEHSMLFCQWWDAGYRKELSDRQWLSSSPHEGGIWVSFALCTIGEKIKPKALPQPPLLGCRHFSCEVVLLTGDVSNTSPQCWAVRMLKCVSDTTSVAGAAAGTAAACFSSPGWRRDGFSFCLTSSS